MRAKSLNIFVSRLNGGIREFLDPFSPNFALRVHAAAKQVCHESHWQVARLRLKILIKLMAAHPFQCSLVLLTVNLLGYLDFLKLMSQARIVLTDSGGIQEETTILRVPCLTLPSVPI